MTYLRFNLIKIKEAMHRVLSDVREIAIHIYYTSRYNLDLPHLNSS